ncbi:hypothetical protein [Amycolatopsis palatopharyngis]|uniref:hypothetical protein n=1 Tax=Amycolatopsis palatopharyngis TaxID=187982 RepID=UPI000E28755A|nr:hypothetical protein [Amycolatopsis palatopharyngis]
MPDVEQLRAHLQRTRQTLQDIDAKIAEAEQETEPPLQRAASATEKAAKRWGIAAAIGLIGFSLWALTRAGQYTTAGILGAAAAIGAAILIAPDPSPPLSSGPPTTAPPGTATSTTAAPPTSAPDAPPPTTSSEEDVPTAGPEPTTDATPATPVTDDATREPTPEQPRPSREGTTGRDDSDNEPGRVPERGDDDDEDADEERRDRCLNVPPEPVVDLNACLSAVSDLATA